MLGLLLFYLEENYNKMKCHCTYAFVAMDFYDKYSFRLNNNLIFYGK